MTTSEARHLTFAEEAFIGAPILLALDELACDFWGCDRAARILVPGAAICAEHSDEFGIGCDELYVVPFGELVGEAFRLARIVDYMDRLSARRAVAPRVRDDAVEATLAKLAGRTIAGLEP